MKFLIIMLVSSLLMAGCGTKQAEDTKNPVSQVGLIDMDKAVKAHPKYKQLMTLGQQADTIAAQLEARQLAATPKPVENTISDMSQQQMVELNKAFEQEFSAKMSAKQEELNSQMAAKVDVTRGRLAEEMEKHNDQLDKEYQPQIFNLQLKMKTLQLSKEEMEVLQAELEKLQAQHSEALAGKQEELAARMDKELAPEKAAMEQQLAAYAQELNEEISKKAATKQADILARGNEEQTPAPQTDQALSQIQTQLTMKQQEAQALQGFILANIADKAAKVAVEKKLDTVLINVAVNISALDITAQVITECNK